MNPFQHGEVFVTDDGAETDLDLGHYERFTDLSLTQDSNTTTGRIYRNVFDAERKGDYLGKTVQLIPHITDEIKKAITKVGKGKDIVIAEIGGTVGDIEAEVFIEAIRQFRRDVGAQNVCYIHVTKIDYIYPSDEPKTKPTQQAVALLRTRGIQPNILVVRSKNGFTKEMRSKIALFCDVDVDDVIPAPNAQSLYNIPLNLEKVGLSKRVCKHLYIPNNKPHLVAWNALSRQIAGSTHTVTIGMVGKYIDNPDAYISVFEALYHAGIANKAHVTITPIDSEEITPANVAKKLNGMDGIVVPGGFGLRGIEGKITAISYARTKKIPFLGLCLGLQCAVIDFARNVCGLKDAHSTEFDAQTPDPVIDILPKQKKIRAKGGTMRLGSYPTVCAKNSLVHLLYGKEKIEERHRHRYEVNPDYHTILKDKGLILSGMSPNGTLVEFIELPKKVHPFFIATQAHPEFKSRPTRPAPLFDGLVRVALGKL